MRFSFSSRLGYAACQVAQHFCGRERVDRLFGAQRARLMAGFLDEARANGPQSLCPVDRRRNLTLAEFRQHYQTPGIPVVFEGAAKDWACCQTWTLDKIVRNCGEDLLPIDHYFARLDPVMQAIAAGSQSYIRFYSLIQRHPEYLEDLDLKWIFERTNPGYCVDQGFQAFIGNSTAKTTALHNANDANLFVQVIGSKQWIFYPSAYSVAIDPSPIRGEYRTLPDENHHFDPFCPDYESFPLFQFIPGYETVLEAGDVLWNPPYVWHAVRNLTDPAIGLAYRWLSPRHCFALEPLYAALDCMAKDPPIWTSLKLADQDFSLVFVEQFPELKKHPAFPEYMQQVSGYLCALSKHNGTGSSLRRLGSNPDIGQ